MALSLIFCAQVEVEASTLQEKVKVFDNVEKTRSLLENVENVTDSTYNPLRNGHFYFGTVELMKVSPTRARIMASTQAHHKCPEVYLDLYVDRYNTKTGNWDQIRNWTYSEKNVQHVTREIEFIVLSGYYYSVRGVHACAHGDVIETGYTQTDGLYIGTTDKPVD